MLTSLLLHPHLPLTLSLLSFSIRVGVMLPLFKVSLSTMLWTFSCLISRILLCQFLSSSYVLSFSLSLQFTNTIKFSSISVLHMPFSVSPFFLIFELLKKNVQNYFHFLISANFLACCSLAFCCYSIETVIKVTVIYIYRHIP